MIGVVFVRKLREGKSYSDFREAWFPDVGFGVPARVISGAGVLDPSEIATVGFLDVAADQLGELGERLTAAEAARHDRIHAVIESTEIRVFFEVEGDDDFAAAPQPVAPDARGYPWSG
jgi:hypothetical protein